jgi:hypothetical protein
VYQDGDIRFYRPLPKILAQTEIAAEQRRRQEEEERRRQEEEDERRQEDQRRKDGEDYGYGRNDRRPRNRDRDAYDSPPYTYRDSRDYSGGTYRLAGSSSETYDSYSRYGGY